MGEAGAVGEQGGAGRGGAGTPAPVGPPPGWYVDPGWSNHHRWWDGTAWTTHVRPATPPPPDLPAPPGLPVPAPAPPPVRAVTALDPATLVEREERQAGTVRTGLVIGMALYALTYGVGAWWLHPIISDYADWIRLVAEEAERRGPVGSTTPDTGGWEVGITVLSALAVPLLAIQLLLMGWAYQAAATAAALGLPARRRPLWAFLGFLIPVVSWWFPYRSLADALPADRRRTVPLRSFWACWLAVTPLGLAALVAAWWSGLASGLLGVATAAAGVAAMALARQVVAGVAAAHRERLDPVPPAPVP